MSSRSPGYSRTQLSDGTFWRMALGLKERYLGLEFEAWRHTCPGSFSHWGHWRPADSKERAWVLAPAFIWQTFLCPPGVWRWMCPGSWFWEAYGLAGELGSHTGTRVCRGGGWEGAGGLVVVRETSKACRPVELAVTMACSLTCFLLQYPPAECGHWTLLMQLVGLSNCIFNFNHFTFN